MSETKLKIMKTALTEYLVGLTCSWFVDKVLLPTFGVLLCVPVVLSALDALFSWQLRLPTWLHTVAVLELACMLVMFVLEHIMHMRAVGREHLHSEHAH